MSKMLLVLFFAGAFQVINAAGAFAQKVLCSKIGVAAVVLTAMEATADSWKTNLTIEKKKVIEKKHDDVVVESDNFLYERSYDFRPFAIPVSLLTGKALRVAGSSKKIAVLGVLGILLASARSVN